MPSKVTGDRDLTAEGSFPEPSEAWFSTKTCFVVMKDGNSGVECPDGLPLVFNALTLIRVKSSLTPRKGEEIFSACLCNTPAGVFAGATLTPELGVRSPPAAITNLTLKGVVWAVSWGFKRARVSGEDRLWGGLRGRASGAGVA